MAYYIDYATSKNDDGGVSTLNAPMPNHEVGDLIVLNFVSDPDNTTETVTLSTTGWTALGPSPVTGNGRRIWSYYKIVTGGTEPDLTATFSFSDDSAYVGVSFRDVDTTTPIETSGFTLNNSNGPTSITPDVTANYADSLYLAVLGAGDSDESHFQTNNNPDYFTLIYEQGIANAGIVVALKQLNQTGSTGTLTFDHPDTRSVGAAYLIKNKTNGKTMPVVQSDLQRLHVYGRFAQGSSLETYPTFFDIYSQINRNINGTPINSGSFTGTNDFNNWGVLKYPDYLFNVTDLQFTYSTEGWIGAYHDLGSTLNATGKLISVWLGVNNAGSYGSDGLGVWLSDGTNWSIFNIPKNEAGGDEEPRNIFISENATPLDSSGSLDFSSITKIGYLYNEGEYINDRDIYVQFLYTIGSQIFTGGSEIEPISITDISLYFEQYPFVDYGDKRGIGQNFFKSSFQIGDGTNETHFDSSTNSLEYPSDQKRWNVAPGDLEIRVKASDADTILFESSVFATSTLVDFIVDSTSSTSATYSFDNFSLIGFKPKFEASISVANMTFIECEQIEGNSCDFDNVSFRRSISTGSALTLSEPTSVVDCLFRKGNESYAIELNQTGSYNFSNTTFSGYTKELNVTTTTGSIEIQLAGGLTSLNFDTSGSTVSFIGESVSVTFTGLKDNSEVRIYSGGTTNELAGIENATDGTSGNRSFTVSTINGGTTVDYRIHNLSYQIIEVYGFTWPSTSQTLPIQQQLDRNFLNPT